jgi:hypothetical protein
LPPFLKPQRPMPHHTNQVWVALLGVALSGMPLLADEVPDCLKISQSVRASVESNLSNLLEIVSTEVAASPACSCEIVKSAIEGSGANAEVVASIVEAAATASPENMRLIAQCAIATVPDSLAQVQAVLAKLDPNAGESGYSAKSSKSGKGGTDEKADEGDNPLDFPGEDPYGRVSIGGEGEGEGGGTDGETTTAGTDGGTDGGTTTGGGGTGGGAGGGTFGGGTFGGGGGGIGGFSSGGGGFNFTGGNSGTGTIPITVDSTTRTNP